MHRAQRLGTCGVVAGKQLPHLGRRLRVACIVVEVEDVRSAGHGSVGARRFLGDNKVAQGEMARRHFGNVLAPAAEPPECNYFLQ